MIIWNPYGPSVPIRWAVKPLFPKHFSGSEITRRAISYWLEGRQPIADRPYRTAVSLCEKPMDTPL